MRGKEETGFRHTILLLLVFLLLCLFFPACSSTQKNATELLAETGVRGGLVVHLGCGDGRLTADLRVNDSYLVHGLDKDPENIEKARAYLSSAGVYGAVSVDRLRGTRLPYIDNSVNLVISDDLQGISEGEILRVLCPEGVSYVKREGVWNKTIKPRPEGLDEWTHFLHDADNNAVSMDEQVDLPYHIQWVGVSGGGGATII